MICKQELFFQKIPGRCVEMLLLQGWWYKQKVRTATNIRGIAFLEFEAKIENSATGIYLHK